MSQVVHEPSDPGVTILLVGAVAGYGLVFLEPLRATLAAVAGARVILLPVGQPDTTTPEEARDTLGGVLKQCIPEAEKAGVVYAVENVGQALARDVRQVTAGLA